MKKIIISFLLFASFHSSYAQSYIDSLKNVLMTNANDSIRAQTIAQIVIFYLDNNLDSSLKYVQQLNEMQSKAASVQAGGFTLMGDVYLRLGNPSKALETLLKALEVEKKINDPFGKSMLYWNMGKVYQSQNDNEKAISYYLDALKITTSAHISGPDEKALAALGLVYLNEHRYDSALYYTLSSYNRIKRTDSKIDLANILIQLGDIQQKLGNSNVALDYYRGALREALPQQDYSALSESSIDVAQLMQKNKQDDSCYYYARQGFIIAQQLNNASLIVRASDVLKDFFKEKNKFDSAFRYQEIAGAAKDSMLSLEKIKKVQSISFEEQQRLRELDAQKKEYQNKVKQYIFILSLALFLFVVIFLYRNNRRKQKLNILLQQQKEKVEVTLSELKATQAQLIQQEKMASLGQVTAGIAHEIQNPLNFINNFSEVNKELLTEMKEEIEKRNINQVRDLAIDIIDNEEKIIHHGKRADAIVKGMLQHSRQTSGTKEPTDINALCEEYLRLSYHGLRAKDKNFNADFKTDFDLTLPKVNVVAQDIGRVILNLINNAFYAVNERKKTVDENYKPTVTVQTKKVNSKIEINVKDNGTGIPESIKEKIFQPFFTTKPTGNGTGLGLSLSYDIIKAHGGALKVETKENEGSTFIIQLPA